MAGAYGAHGTMTFPLAEAPKDSAGTGPVATSSLPSRRRHPPALAGTGRRRSECLVTPALRPGRCRQQCLAGARSARTPGVNNLWESCS